MRELKSFPHRNWTDLRDDWINHLPSIDFQITYPEPSVWDFLRTNFLNYDKSENEIITYTDGLRESAFRESILLLRKFNYCRSTSIDSARNGFSTWSVIAGYDACFYGAKAFCYMLGMVSVGRHSKVYMDIFHRHNVKTKGRGYIALDCMTHRLTEALTHSALWSITGRLARTVKVNDQAGMIIFNKLKNTDFDSVSNLRNNLIYDGGYWLSQEPSFDCDLRGRMSNLDVVRHLSLGTALAGDVIRYYDIAGRLSETLHFMVSDIAKLVPALRDEADAISNWRTF